LENLKENIHCYSGVNKYERARAGISIAVQRKLQRFVKNWEPINERIIKVVMKIKERRL
jgi:hypothetical protein